MLSRLDLRDGEADLGRLLERPTSLDDEVVAVVRDVLGAVRDRGDAAVRELTARFDGAHVEDLRVPASELAAALAAAPPTLRVALERTAERVRAYHEAQAVSPPVGLDADGVRARELVVPVGRAGLYVPGGRAAYPSTVLMTAIPARVAGVPEVALCVPPERDGTVATPTLAAAALAGVDEVYRVGGAQAVAALAYGTETIRPVDVVVGPGNRYVSVAKRLVADVVRIEAEAGPSELVVVADGTAPAEWVAADLAAQAEHGPDGTAVLVTWDLDVAEAVDAALRATLARATRRDEIAATLSTGGRCVLVRDGAQAMTVVNALAPEHLELVTADPGALVPLVRNAGAIFCGRFTPAVLGDYGAGPNHVLPTGRTARFASALRVDHFRKHIPVVEADERGLGALGPTVQTLARAEGLAEHARAVALRIGPA